MSRNVRRTALAAALLAIACLVPTLAVSGTAKVAWEPGENGGGESLVLQFSQGIPNLDVEAQPWGFSIFLPGIQLDAQATQGLRALAEPGGTRLRVERPGKELRSMKIDGSTVRLLLGARRSNEVSVGGSTYRIGIGDVLAVSVYKNADLTGDFTVAPDGTINVPLVGTIVAKGLTDVELTSRLREVLDRDFLVDPQVSVTVKTYQSQWVYIAGTVARAARVPLSPGMSFKDILSEAGVGLGPEQQIVLSRTGGEGETLTIDGDSIDRADLPAPRDGDVLTVQEPGSFFVQGEVRRPGRLPVTPSMTLLQAITLAEGLTEWASKKDVRVRRTQGGETSEEVVNLKKIEERKMPDTPIKAGDIILVKRKVL